MKKEGLNMIDGLQDLTKEQLIYIYEKLHHALFQVSEICVEESKLHITAEKGIEKIREALSETVSPNNVKYLNVIPVRRCKDCKYFESEREYCWNWHKYYFNPDDFCSKADGLESYDKEKCKRERHIAAIADDYCSDSCYMEGCPYGWGKNKYWGK